MQNILVFVRNLFYLFIILGGLVHTWSHGWQTPLEGQFIDFGYTFLSEAQAEFVANHYQIYSVEKCTGWRQGMSTEQATYQLYKRVKKYNPSIKILFYINTAMTSVNCYWAHETLLANPDWWLRNSTGHVVFESEVNNIPYLDFRVPEAREWFANIPNNSSATNLLIDGVLVDGTGGRCPKEIGFTGPVCDAWILGMKWAVGNMTKIFNALGGEVLCNGATLYNLPGFPSDNGLSWVEHCSGLMVEHVASFENILPNGALNISAMNKTFEIIKKISSLNKTVVMATWPGLLKQPQQKNGFFSWPSNSPSTPPQWREALLRFHKWALALWMTVAEENVFMQYQAWYTIQQGAVPCDISPGIRAQVCASPGSSEWYPDLFRPLGKPLGSYNRTGNILSRRFENAVSILNLDNPEASTVTFQVAN